MAIYPLKNIKIGSNTYQIQGGEFYVIEVGIQGYSASDFSTFPQTTNITGGSTVTVYDANGTVQSGFDWSKLASAPCVAHIITSGSGANIDSFAGFIGIDANQYPTLYSASFESDWKSPSSVPTRYGIRIDILNNSIDEVRGYAIQVGAGGGSSSIEEIVISQIGNGDANITNLWNISSGATATVLNGPTGYKSVWLDPSKTYVLRLAQDNTLIYLTQRLLNGSSFYTAYATIQKYDFNDPQTHVIQFVCSGSTTLTSFNVKRCTVQ